MHIRVFNVLDGLFFVEDPLLPGLEAILHGAQDDLRNLEPRVSQADCVDRGAFQPENICETR